MEKNRKRALRRHHTRRMHKRAVEMVKGWYWPPEAPSRQELFETARRYRDHMKVCSCSSCGNPRNNVWSHRREKMTMPERKAEDSYLDQLEEVYAHSHLSSRDLSSSHDG